MGLPTSLRSARRVATAPAIVTDVAAEVDQPFPIRIPSTEEVQRHLRLGGSGTTLRDVALGIVKRLLESPDNDPSEVLFLAECLQAGSALTALPCGLLRWVVADGGDADEGHADADVSSWLIRTYGSSDDTPKSSHSHPAPSSRNSRQPSFALSVATSSQDLSDDSTIPRWHRAMTVDNQVEVDAFMEANFSAWGLDVFQLSKLTAGRSLQFVGWEALRQGGFLEEFDIDVDKAHCFLTRVESCYASSDSVPYHNSLHAADVTHSVHALLGTLGFGQYFGPLSRFALLLGAMVHDMGHDGRNNAFHTNVQDHFALTYNDRSVLENYHVSQAFRLLKESPEANLLEVLDKEEIVLVRKDMVDSVLATDMAHHFRGVETIKNYIEKLDLDPADWEEEPAALSALQAMLLHAADIGNPGKPAALSDRWTDLLRQEFYNQGDLEKSLGLTVSPLCDRNVQKFASSQVGFIQFIVRPTWDALEALSPAVTLVSREICLNLARWEGHKAAEEVEDVEGL